MGLTFVIVIVLQMFIAVINENFEVAEEAKRSQQATSFWANEQTQQGPVSWTRYLNPYRWFRPSPRAIVVENLRSDLVLPMQKAIVQGNALGRQNSVGRSVGLFFISDGYEGGF